MTTPRIEPFEPAAYSAARPRPLLSVVVPTFEPCVDRLAHAVRSVGAQLAVGGQVEWGGQVELLIVDDGSRGFDPHAFVARLGTGGVGVVEGEHLGMAGNWNRAVSIARGQWVHVLHQDDYVLPGFYDAFFDALGSQQGSGLGAFFCTALFDDYGGGSRLRSPSGQAGPGVLLETRRHVFERLQMQASAVIVRRVLYERLGGFDDDFSYVADWDMWKRIARAAPIWHDPRALACYRRHAQTQSARLGKSALINEIGSGILRSAAREVGVEPLGVAARTAARTRDAYTLHALESACASIRYQRDPLAALAALRAGFGLHARAGGRAAPRLRASVAVLRAALVLIRRAARAAPRACCPTPLTRPH